MEITQRYERCNSGSNPDKEIMFKAKITSSSKYKYEIHFLGMKVFTSSEYPTADFCKTESDRTLVVFYIVSILLTLMVFSLVLFLFL